MRNHSNLGALSYAPILLVAITGVILVYPEQSRWLLLDDQSAAIQINLHLPSNVVANDWPLMLNTVTQTYPNSQMRWVSPTTDTNPNTMIGVQQKRGWNRLGQTTLSFDMSNGQTTSHNALQQSIAERALNFTYPLHAGKLGLWYRLCLSIFGLSLALISLLGLASYIRSKGQNA